MGGFGAGEYGQGPLLRNRSRRGRRGGGAFECLCTRALLSTATAAKAVVYMHK